MTRSLSRCQHGGIGTDQAMALPQRQQSLILHALDQMGIQVPQCGHMQFGSRLGKGSIGDMAQQASACAFTAEVGKEAVKFALNAAATKTAQCGDQCRQGQFARAGEGLWEIRVTSLSRKSRALDVFGQPG